MNNVQSSVRRLATMSLVSVMTMLAACGGSSTPPTPITTDFGATLFGAQEVNAVATPAVGFGSLSLSEDSGNNTNTLSGRITTIGLAATAAHIHGPGAGGVNAPVLIGLTETPVGSGVWAVPAAATLTAAQVASLKAGDMYFNAHTTANPGGEIRGQIGRDVRTAVLTGAQEVPANASAATGKGVVVIDPATRAMTATATTTGVTGTVAHIHEEVAGVSGGVIFPLTQTAAASGIWSTTVTLTEAQYTALKSGRYYFNVHSAAFAAGEIRGQIGPVFGTTNLTGAAEVPANASTATGTGIIVVDPVTLAVSVGLKTVGVVGGNVAHVHGPAAVGVNAPPIVALTQSATVAGNWNAASGAVLTPAQLASLITGNLYFNAHSLPTYAGGEIRGQIGLK